MQLLTGIQTTKDGQVHQGRSDRTGATVVTDGHAKYKEAVLRENVFTASASAIAVTTVGATTYTGFVLTNPVGSGKNLVLMEVLFGQTSTAASTANALVALGGQTSATAVTHTTALTVRNALLGNSSTGAGLADSGATLPTAATLLRALWQPSVSATATTGIPPVVKDQVDGAIVLAPGTYLIISAASALSGSTTMVWEELPV